MATALERRIKNAASGKSKLGFNPLSDQEPHLSNIRIEDIEIDSNQPRTDIGDLAELKSSIKQHGILQPIVVSPASETTYRIITGERRYIAVKSLRHEKIPALVRTVEEQNRLELQIIENLHRKNLNPMEEARSYRRLMDEFNLSQAKVAKRIGKSRISINEMLRLLDFPEEEIHYLEANNSISKSLLVEIVRIEDEERRLELLRLAKAGRLTVKEARKIKLPGENDNPKERFMSKKIITSKGDVILRIKEKYSGISNLRQMLEEALEQLAENGENDFRA